MKNTLITSALVAIVGLAFVGASITAQAQTTNAPATTAPATKAVKTPYKGSITAIDASSVTVASKDKTLTLAITPETKYKVGKASATLPKKKPSIPGSTAFLLSWLLAGVTYRLSAHP